PEREGLARTPERVARALAFLTKGHDEDPRRVINGALFIDEEYSEMIVLKDIDFYSLCEHHILPFFGKAHVAYLPNRRIVGISKLARLVEVYARRLQVQERMTSQRATTIAAQLEPAGAGAVRAAGRLAAGPRGARARRRGPDGRGGRLPRGRTRPGQAAGGAPRGRKAAAARRAAGPRRPQPATRPLAPSARRPPAGRARAPRRARPLSRGARARRA